MLLDFDIVPAHECADGLICSLIEAAHDDAAVSKFMCFYMP